MLFSCSAAAADHRTASLIPSPVRQARAGLVHQSHLANFQIHDPDIENHPFFGSIKSLRIHPRALTAQEVKDLPQ